MFLFDCLFVLSSFQPVKLQNVHNTIPRLATGIGENKNLFFCPTGESRVFKGRGGAGVGVVHYGLLNDLCWLARLK